MRGVELGSVGRAASVAPVIARGIGPAIGRIPPLEGGFSVKSIANPFKGVESAGFPLQPAGSSYIENRGPSLLEPNIGVIRNPEAKAPSQTTSVANPNLPSGLEAVDIVEKWLEVSSQPQNNHYILDQTWANRPREHNENSRRMDFIWATESQVLPAIQVVNEPKIQPKVNQIEFSKAAPKGAVLTQLDKKSVQENAVGQSLTEEVLVKEKVDEKPEISEREEVKEWKIKDLLDEETAEQRIYEIGEAIDLAETEAKIEGVEEIEGWRILKFLRLHIGLISRIARKIRKDGSLDETLEELAARKFSSRSQAKQQSKELVAEKEPVRRGKEGKTVKEGAVERVLKYHFVKRSPNQEVATRVVKKQEVQTSDRESRQVIGLEPLAPKESKIEDYPDSVAQALKPAA